MTYTADHLGLRRGGPDFAKRNDDAFPGALAAAVARGVPLQFLEGAYWFTWGLVAALSGARIVGLGPGTELRFIGAAAACVDFDGGADSGVLYDCELADMVIVGNAGAARGVRGRGMRAGRIDNVRVDDVTTDAFQFVGCESVECHRLVCSINFRNFYRSDETPVVLPTAGVRVEARAGAHSTVLTFEECMMEGLYTGHGFHVDGADNCQILRSTSQGNLVGVESGPDCGVLRIDGPFFEHNAGDNIRLGGHSAHVTGVRSSGYGSPSTPGVVRFLGANSNPAKPNSYNNFLDSGSYDDVVNESALAQGYGDGCLITGTLTDAVTPAARKRYMRNGVVGG